MGRGLTRLHRSVSGALALLLLAVNTVFWTGPLLLLQLFKVAYPGRRWRRFWSGLQNRVGAAWISFNNLTFTLTNPVRWDVRAPEGLAVDRWYLVIANHQSWVDILVLQTVFNGRVPFLKFFLKKELFWVPFLGLAWWTLDYPFLERSNRAGKDLEAIRQASERFKLIPVSVMNFVEGTRFTVEKHHRQRYPYQHLLKPKAGGMVFLLSSMKEEVHSVLDVTIAYPGGAPSLWGFLSGGTEEIRVRVREIPVGDELKGDYRTDKAFRRRFTSWQRGIWAEKDQELASLLEEGSLGGPPSENLPGGS